MHMHNDLNNIYATFNTIYSRVNNTVLLPRQKMNKLKKMITKPNDTFQHFTENMTQKWQFKMIKVQKRLYKIYLAIVQCKHNC